MQHGATRPGLLAPGGGVERLFNSFWVRLALSLLILASLLPHPDDDLTDLGFLAIFGVELGLRVALFRRRAPDADDDARARRRRALAWLYLALDLVALLTFVPW